MAAQQQQGVYTKTVYILLGLMIFFGACNTLVSKWQNSHSFPNPDPTKGPIQFHHPFMQSLTMFIGEFCSIFIFLGYKKLYPQDLQMQEEEAVAKGLLTTKKKYLFLLFPAFCDFCSSCLQYVSLTYLSPSIYQMLRGGIVIITALFSKIFLKRILYKHNYLGIVLVIVGISIVGGANFLFPASSNTSTVSEKETAIAIVLLISAQVFSGGIYISEEKIIRTYHLIPYEVVGTEGFWGIAISCIFLPILCNVSCPLGENSCVTYEGDTTFESPRQFLSQLGSQGTLFFAWFSGVITICCFNICGINVTKRVNSLARAVVDATRTFIIWIVGIILTDTVGGKFYSWENLRGEAIALEIVGFLMLVAGNLTYNEIISWPCARPPSQEQKDQDMKDQLLQYSLVQTQKQSETKKRRKEQAKESFGSFHN